MTGPEHYLAAARLQEHARAMAAAVTAQRVQRRMAPTWRMLRCMPRSPWRR
jgi:hypothetical protein